MLWDTSQLVPWRDTENSGGVPPVQWACSVQGILWHHGKWLVIKTSLNCTSYYKFRFHLSKPVAPPGPSTTVRQRSLFWAILFNWLHEWLVFLMSTSRSRRQVFLGRPPFLLPWEFQISEQRKKESASPSIPWPIKPLVCNLSVTWLKNSLLALH